MPVNNNQTFQGAPYPITSNPKGFLYSQSGMAQIESDLMILFGTNPGERVMLPSFGTPLRQLAFEPNDIILASQARDAIINAINKWEKRVIVQNISVTNGLNSADADPNDPGTDFDKVLLIKISLSFPNNIQQVQELTLEIPLKSN